MSPSLMYSKPASFAAEVKKLLGNKATKIGNQHDLDRCIRDRSGGCLVVYSPRAKDDVMNEISSFVDANPSVKFATFDGNALSLKPAAGSTAHKLMTAAVRTAREHAEKDGARGELLLLFKRVPPSVGASASAVVTVGYTSIAGTISGADIDKVLAGGKTAMGVLTGDGASASAGGDAIEALLERDDNLLDVNSALLNRGDLLVARSSGKHRKQQPPKGSARIPLENKQAPAAGSDEEAESATESAEGTGSGSSSDDGRYSASKDTEARTPEERRARRERLKAKYGTGATSKGSSSGATKRASTPTPTPTPTPTKAALSPEQLAELERRREAMRREEMAREQAESGHVAFAADEEEGEGGAQDAGSEEGSVVVDEEVAVEGDSGGEGDAEVLDAEDDVEL